ncbi:MAG: flagellar hook assembly protein FlgD [Bacteroidota bacterium]|jgi:flagellar basal-body rod modification protein FlgD|nr:flagellar hook capping protein [Ignavibacteria bacterium]MCU7499308.1 flagellar hook capping protein [Ignavibacteria bacterium]MCU7512537.1 flagellar hook capping protein [Ignavibacteria bacterium]MCU7519685.1 flagellar hook capping protein [Ignavibacteria bacterium]MCU7524555.1 flagellar hook capping protein [Ignavibacteria bacterium]
MAGEINGVTTGSSGTVKNTGTGKNVLGKDDFMKLMISQLKYQDPLNPMDGTQFSAQLAQFSSLEQLTNMNDSLNQSIQANYLLTQSVNNTMSASLIGKDIKLSGSGIIFNGQENVQLGYNLAAKAKSAQVNIYDSTGKLVKSFENENTSQGDHKLLWDFTDNNGNKLPNGKYTFEVKAKGQDGQDMTAEIFKYGVIDSVRFTEEGTKIMIDKAEYNISDVLEVFGNNS